MKNIKTVIEKEGQRYVDKPVVVEVAKRFFSPLEDALARVYGNVTYYQDGDGRPRSMRTDLPRPILLRHDRVRLRWMKPDGRGGLVPKNERGAL